MTVIEITEIKSFMNKLFLEEAFDSFHVSEARFVTFSTFYIDGALKKDYYSKEELEVAQMENQRFSSWRQIRPFCLNLIRGKHTPLEFKIVFRLSPANVEKLISMSHLPLQPSDIDGLFLNLHYQAGALTCTTGTSLRIFTMDKSVDSVWDDMVKKFFVSTHLN